VSQSAFVAVEIGGTKLQVCAGSMDGIILRRERFAVQPDLGAAGIQAQIVSCIPPLLDQWRPRGVGVGFGGPVDWRTGCVCRSHHLEGWAGFPLGDWLSDLCGGMPVRVDNDANVAALGEARCGAGRGRDPVFYVTMGSGVGGGLVMGGEIYHGYPPGEMELGHVRLDRAGTIVEDRCSGWSLDRRIRELAAREPDGALGRMVAAQAAAGLPGGAEARHLGDALAAGDTAAGALLDEHAADLAFALSHVVHLAHPDVIVLGGGVALLGARLRDAVARALPGFLMEVFRPGPSVELAALAEDAVPVGALRLAQAAGT